MMEPRLLNQYINLIKEFFEKELTKNLHLEKVQGPLIIEPSTGLNDNLTGQKQAVKFYCNHLNRDLEIVQSLAKWKRFALSKYHYQTNQGLFVDMKAIRAHEDLDNLHSLYVDQWDWELVIDNNQRDFDKLFEIVNLIYRSILNTQQYINNQIKTLHNKLPDQIVFFDTQELENMFPNKEFEQIVYDIVREFKAVFFVGIGKQLASQRVFDYRAPDYDDWNLNGDLFVWSDVINKPIELSSMGIRVNKEALLAQSNLTEQQKKIKYYEMILNNQLPQTIGGGIGQSRLVMFLLELDHIKQVQVSVWNDNEQGGL